MKDRPLDTTDLTWLAGLARALLRDVHAADDLAQETACAALTGPIPTGDRRRPWLRSVARRLAARRFRSDARRTRREARAARSEAVSDSAELVQRAELAERVAAAARGLPEPYRRTILLRFLEGLSPEEIARGSDTSPDTVRWRVRRGLELLRAELSPSGDGRGPALSVLLLPLARSGGDAGAATAGASGVFAGMVACWSAMKITIVAAACLGFGAWLMWDTTAADGNEGATIGGGPAKASRSESAPQGESGESPATAVGIVSVPYREVLATNAPSEEPGVRGRVVDERLDPVSGATVYLIPSAEGTDAGRPNVIGQTESDMEGRFHIPETLWRKIAHETPLDLGVVANGFLRQIVPEAWRGAPRDHELLVVLETRNKLLGRVIDESGRPVGGLELMAHTAYAGIDHVSPSQVLLRARRAELGNAASDYHQSRGRTDAGGEVVFTGLPSGELWVRSIDPGWTIEEPARVKADGNYVVWRAKQRLGVRLNVVEKQTGRRVKKAAAVFRIELAFGDGQLSDYGQWVGRGNGGATFMLGAGTLPDLSGRTITRATFYGTVRVGGATVPWKADPLEDPRGVSGVAEARVEIDASTPVTAVARAQPPEKLPEPPTAALEIDARYADGGLLHGVLTVRWESRGERDGTRRGTSRPSASSPGRYRIDVPAGNVTLEVAEWGASGSLASWTGAVMCDAIGVSRANVTLPRGAAVSITRPDGWKGEWFVHASWRELGDDRWRGSWNHSTKDGTLVLSALRAAEWRFRLRRTSQNVVDPIVRTVILAAGDDVVVDR